MVALNVYLDGTNSTVTGLTALARKLQTSTAGLTVAAPTTKVAKSTGWDKVNPQGAGGNWAAGASLAAPTGEGWVLEGGLLDAQTMAAGAWTGTIRLTSSATFTADVVIRISKRSSAGVYTLIADARASAQAIATTGTNVAVSTANAGGSAGVSTDFVTGDTLYIGVNLNITTASASSTGTVTPAEGAGANFSLVTPGYAASPLLVTGGAALTAAATLTADAGVVAVADSTLTAASTLTTDAVRSTFADSAMTALATLTPNADVTKTGTAALTAASTLTTAGTRASSGAASMVSTAFLTTSASAASPITNVSFALYENGVFRANLGTVPITNAAVVRVPWNSSMLTDATGAGAELRITSDVGADIGAVEWNSAISSVVYNGAVAMQAASTLSGTTSAGATAGTASLTAAASMTTAGVVARTAAVTMTAASTMTTGGSNTVVAAVGGSATVEDFTTLPSDIYKSSGAITIVNGALQSYGSNGFFWHFTGPRFQVNGSFDVTYDVTFPGTSGRDIANFKFYYAETGAQAAGNGNGWCFRLDSGSSDANFLSVTNGAHGGTNMGGETVNVTSGASVPFGVVLRTRLVSTVAADGLSAFARAVTTRMDNGVVIRDISRTLLPDAAHPLSGTFGQKQDGAGTAEGHRWDNISLVATPGLLATSTLTTGGASTAVAAATMVAASTLTPTSTLTRFGSAPLTALSTLGTSTPQNLALPNDATFESTPVTWGTSSNGSGTLARSQEQAAEGSWSYKVTRTSTGTMRNDSPRVPVSGGQHTGLLSIYSTVAGATQLLAFDCFNSGGGFLGATGGTTTTLTQNAWTQCKVTQTFPAGTSQVAVTIFPSNTVPSVGDVAYYDKFGIFPGDVATWTAPGIDASNVATGAATLAATSALSTAAVRSTFAAAPLVAGSSLTATPNTAANAVASMVAASTLTPSASAKTVAVAALTASSVLGTPANAIPVPTGQWVASDLALTNGATVASWPGTGGTFTQATAANQPLYITNAVNGKPAVSFDGTNDSLLNSTFTLTSRSYFVVFRRQGPGQSSPRLIDSAGPAVGPLLYFSANGLDYYNPQLTVGAVTLGTFYVAASTHGGSGVATFLNGAAGGASSSLPATTGLLSLGSNGGGTENGQVDIAEVLVYDRALTPAERAQVDSYLSDKYAITVADYVAGSGTPAIITAVASTSLVATSSLTTSGTRGTFGAAPLVAAGTLSTSGQNTTVAVAALVAASTLSTAGSNRAVALASLVAAASLGSARTAIPAPVGWWKADDLALANGAEVLSWASASGSVAFTGVTGSAPLYTTNALNGKPVLTFGNPNARMLVPTTFTYGQPDTIIIVGKRTGGGNSYFYDSNDANQRQALGTGLLGNPETTLDAYAGLAGLTTPNADHATTHIWTTTFAGLPSTMHRDGTQVATGQPGSQALTGISLGSRYSNTDFLVGQIAEVLVFDHALTAAERSQVHSYLSDKYAITVADYVAGSGTPASVTAVAAAALVASSSLTPNAVASTSGAASMVAASTVTTSATVAAGETSNLVAASSLSTAASNRVVAADSLVAAAVLSTTGTRGVTGSAPLVAASTMTTSSVVNVVANSALVAASVLTTAGVIARAATSSLTAASALTTSGQSQAFAVSAMTAASVLSTSGANTSVTSASLVAASTMSTAAFATSVASSSLVAATTMSTAGIQVRFGTSAMTAAAVLSASGLNRVNSAASLVAASVLSTTGLYTAVGTAPLVAAASLSTASVARVFASTSLVAGSTLSTSGVLARLATSSLVAASSLSTAGTSKIVAIGALSASAVLGTSGQVAVPGVAVLTGAASLAILPTLRVISSASLNASSTLTTPAILVTNAVAALVAQGTLTTGAVLFSPAMATLIAQAVMTVLAEAIVVPAHGSISARNHSDVIEMNKVFGRRLREVDAIQAHKKYGPVSP